MVLFGSIARFILAVRSQRRQVGPNVLIRPSPALGVHAGAVWRDRPPIATHDSVGSAGKLHGRTLALSLRVAIGRWYPEGPSGRERRVPAFGEEGDSLSIPAPLVRVPRGTEVRATVRNTLSSSLELHGFCDRDRACDSIIIAAGATRELRFALGSAGTSSPAPKHRLASAAPFPDR